MEEVEITSNFYSQIAKTAHDWLMPTSTICNARLRNLGTVVAMTIVILTIAGPAPLKARGVDTYCFKPGIRDQLHQFAFGLGGYVYATYRYFLRASYAAQIVDQKGFSRTNHMDISRALIRDAMEFMLIRRWYCTGTRGEISFVGLLADLRIG
jgi:hypothetical protein